MSTIESQNITESPTFAITDYEQFSKAVESDIRGRASAAESAWLRKPAVLIDWLRELGFVRRSVQASLNFIAEEKRTHPLNPRATNGQSPAWLEISDEMNSRRTRALKFLSYVEARIKEATFLVSTNGLAKFNETDLLIKLQTIENLLIDNESESALASLSAVLDDFGDGSNR
jgi:hypothetical protein